jgi:hypothetical protein
MEKEKNPIEDVKEVLAKHGVDFDPESQVPVSEETQDALRESRNMRVRLLNVMKYELDKVINIFRQ